MDEITDRLYKIAEYEDDCEIEEIAEKLEELREDMIINIGNFKRELDRQGLLTAKLEDFIDNYVRWDNE